MGHMTEHWIAAAPDPTTSTTAPGVPAPVGLLATSGAQTVAWVNDELGDLPIALGEDVVGAVWSRSNQEDKYVQASRSEMAVALPGLEFPGLIPEKVTFITSQLVFDPSTGKLAADPVAAFGFWTVKPYTMNRSVAQSAVLLVAVDAASLDPVVPDTVGVPENLPEDTRCSELVGSTVEVCEKVTLEGGLSAWSLDVADGWRLAWSELGYKYDLFVRNADDVDLLARMAGSSEELAPLVSVRAGADAAQGAPVKSEAEPPAASSGS